MSCTVVEVFRYAVQDNYKFKALILRSVFENHDYSEMTKKRCKEHNINAEIFEMEDLKTILERSDYILTGADMICPDLVVNGSPSRYLAEINNNQIPFYVAAESFKYADEPNIAPGFDKIDRNLIQEIISDKYFKRI